MSKTELTVRELVDKVQRGELRLPEMQRQYVWTATRVRDLLDSLYRGYPSGTILVWETDEEINDRDMAVKSTKNPITSQRLLLLDGQQRTTSLAAILSGDPVHVRHRKRPIEVLFNLNHPDGPPTEVIEVNEMDNQNDELDEDDNNEIDIQEEMKKRTFVVMGRALKNDPNWIQVSEVFKKTDSQILKNIGLNSDDDRWDKYSERLQNLRKIQDYKYSMEVLRKELSYEEVTEIFVRVNSLGIKLRGSDLASAQISSKWKGFVNELEDFTKEFKDDEAYLLETGLPIRLMVIFATHQSRFKTVGKLSKSKLSESWELAKKGLSYAVNFIKSNAGIEDLDYISSHFLLIPIAVYYIKNDEKISDKETKKLLKWFYLAHMRGHYGMGSTESILDADLSILFKENNIDSLINQLHTHVKKFDITEEDIAKKGIRSPFFSMLFFVLKHNGAKDWWTGLKLSDKHVGKSHFLQYHHIFPKSLIKEKYDKKEINEIANLAFIGGKTNRTITNTEPKKYFDKIIEKYGEEPLISQLIPPNKELWPIEEYKRFLEYRRKEIAKELSKFMRQFD